jgi:hypothetical protein
MEARLKRFALLVALLLVSMGARHQSANYIVETADPRLAVQFAEAAEKYRHDLAVEWVGEAMPNWSQPCMMTVEVGPNLGAGGATTFVFDRGEVFGWKMNIQGSAERIFDSVLPHEITHMVFASHFRRPLPRWADEGGATSVECASEKAKHRTMLNQFLRTNRGIAFSQMFAMTEYPRDVMPLYAQSYALSEYLIQHGGRRKFIAFLDDGMNGGQWATAVKRHYGISDLGSLQNTWVAWVANGFPEPAKPVPAKASPAAVAVVPVSANVPTESSVATARRPRPEPNLVYHTRDKADAATAEVPAAADAATSAGQTAATPARPAVALPVTGWRPSGAPQPPDPPPPAPSANPTPNRVTRPPAAEPPRQMVLE